MFLIDLLGTLVLIHHVESVFVGNGVLVLVDVGILLHHVKLRSVIIDSVSSST